MLTFKQYTLLSEGARIQHAEDIIFWEGSQGALRALNSLKSIASDRYKDVSVKFDGSPAVIFGRDEDGDFILTDKSGFVAKKYDGKSKSPSELQNMLLNRSGGRNRENPSYVAFANRMKNIFPLYEKSVPEDFRGFFKGDLLYFDTPEVLDGRYTFTPNIVEYAVKTDSDLGKRIGASKSGIVIHRMIDSEGDESPLQSYDIFKGKDVLVLPPVIAQQPIDIDESEITSIESKIKRSASNIDELLDSDTLRELRLTDFPQILYAYTNSKVDTGLENLGKDFTSWLSNSKVSKVKQERISEYIQDNEEAFIALWTIIEDLMNLKDTIIAQLDEQDIEVTQSIGGQRGGEGYVYADPAGDIKLVPRKTFTAANRAVQR